jgi:hypothetical protein
MKAPLIPLARAAATAVVVLAVAACVTATEPSEPSSAGESAASSPILRTGLPTLSAVDTPPPAVSSGSTATAGPSALASAEVGEANNGGSITVTVGAQVKLALHSIYWSGVATSDPAVLAQVGEAGYGPGTIKCIPGTGCGLLSATFRAASPGTATITAHRTNCGQERPCPSDQKDFAVTIVVVAA